jgi:iron(III) transport system substrate-binding protein
MRAGCAACADENATFRNVRHPAIDFRAVGVFMSHRRQRVLPVALLASAGLVLAACSSGTETGGNGSGAPAEQASNAEEACQTAAESGGQLRHWATTDAEVFEQMIEPFTEAHPDIEVEYTSLRPNDAVQQVLTQVQTGRDVEVDSVAMSLPYVGPLLENDLVESVDWAALDIPEDQILELDGGESFYRNYRMVSGLVYNSDLVDEADLPDTWEGLVDEQWKGRIVVDPRGTYLSRLTVEWGPDKTIAWYDDLMATAQPLVVQGATASLQKVIAGEALASTSAHDSEVLEQRATGAPLEIKYLDVVPTQDYHSMIIKGSPNVAAAQCFLAWYASEEGQAQQLEFEYKNNVTEPEAIPAGSAIANIETVEQAEEVAEVGAQLAQMSGPGQ